MDSVPDDQSRIAKILGEWFERRDRGMETPPEEVIRAHPELAEELSAHFRVQRILEESLPDLTDDMPREVGEFRIIREMGRGGMGVVYEAEQSSLRRRVALKVLTPAITNVSESVSRFRREARSAARLHHTNIAPVHAMGRHQGLWYYVMELVEGPSLARAIAETRRSAAAAKTHFGSTTRSQAFFTRLAGMFAGVADALHAAHEEGVIHRDVKPSNLLLAADGTLKLVDFGLARLTGEGATMTVTGQLMGTPAYMSPEQATGHAAQIDRRTDVYSLGATLYEALTLRPPFRGEGLQQTLVQIASKEPPRPRALNHRIPKDLETILLKAMEKRPRERYATAGAMAQDLRRFANGAPIGARRVGPAGWAWRKVKRNKVRASLVGAVLVLAVVGTLLGISASRERERRTQLEYEALLDRAMESTARPLHAFWVRRSHAWRDVTPAEALVLLDEAIALDPDRPEAYLGRCMARQGDIDLRLADLDSAQRLGLAERTVHLVRACLAIGQGKDEAAEQERRLADACSGRAHLDAFFEASLAASAGDLDGAKRILTRCIDGAGGDTTARLLAYRLRATLRQDSGEFPEAIEDLNALVALGADGPDVRLTIATMWRLLKRDALATGKFDEAMEEALRSGSEFTLYRFCVTCRNVEQQDWHGRATEKALQLHPDSALCLAERAAFFHLGGRMEEALELAKRAVATGRDVHQCQATYASIQDQLGNYEEALKALRAAVAAVPECITCYCNLGFTLQDIGKREKALAHFESAIERFPTEPMPWMGKGNLLWCDFNEFEPALASYEHALKLSPGKPAVLRSMGGILNNMERFPDAARCLRQAIAGNDRDVLSHSWLAVALTGLGEHDEAVAEAQRAIELAPRSVDAHYQLAGALRGAGELGESVATYRKTIAMAARAPKWQRSHLHDGLGVVLQEQEKQAEAKAEFETAIELGERNPYAHAHLAELLRKQGELDTALETVDAGLEAAPGFRLLLETKALVLYDHGNALYGLRRVDEAAEAWEEALRLDPDHDGACCNLGNVWNQRGNADKAMELFERAVKSNPNNGAAQTNLGAQYLDRRRYRDAIELFTRALEADPPFSYAHYPRALAWRMLGEHTESLRDLSALIGDGPGRTWWQSQLGYTLLLLGKKEEARAALAQALELGNNPPNVYRRHVSDLRRMGFHEEALPWAEKLCELNLEEFASLKIYCLRATGKAGDARKIARSLTGGDIVGDCPFAFAYLCAVAGRAEKARRVLVGCGKITDPFDALEVAKVQAVLGDAKEALRWLTVAVDAGLTCDPVDKPDPEFAALAKDPKFVALRKRMLGE